MHGREDSMRTTDTVHNTTKLSPAVAHAGRLTEVYRQHQGSHPAVREAACLREQFPAILSPIESGDMFAGGHIRERIVYAGTMWWAMMPCRCGPGKQGGYCFDFAAAKRYEQSEADSRAVAQLDEFWSRESTWSRIERSWEPEMAGWLHGNPPVNGRGSGFVVAMELDRLLQHGLPGMAAVVDQRRRRAELEHDGEGVAFCGGLAAALDIVQDMCRHYAQQARSLASDAVGRQDRARLERIAVTLDSLRVRAPRTLFEATQLWWLYSVMTCGLHIEGWRLDVALGDFYARDIDNGTLTEEEAQKVVAGLWRMYLKHSDPAVSRAIVGGKGRRNEANADRFALAAMEVTRRLRQVIPQLTLRFHRGQNPSLLSRAYDVIGEGCTYPMLYNDDVNVPATSKSPNVPLSDAERYYPLGCGEYMVGGASPSLLNVGWSVPRSLEAALFGGRGAQGERLGPQTPRDLPTFESLWNAFMTHVDHGVELGAYICAENLRVQRHDAPFLLASLLVDDCVERGRGVVQGGGRYIGSCIMAHGFSNASDALTAIKRLVYDTKQVTLDTVRAALTANFEGHEPLRKRLAGCPKFGNDDAEADGMLARMWREMSCRADAAGRSIGMRCFTVSSVNPGGYFMGAQCGATADGRRAGEPFAIGNAPTAGADRSGVTAMLNSISRVDPVNGGATTSIKLAKSLFAHNRSKLEMVLDTFWKNGGMQATLTVVDQEDLRDALEHPERYPHLLVRIGGWTARFVEQSREVQQEIIRRTLY